MSERRTLAAEIHEFLAEHARKSNSYDFVYDRIDERFYGPDPAVLEAAAIAMDKGCEIDIPIRSDWGSGLYKPYSDEKARAWHDDLVARVNALQVSSSPR